MPPLPRIKDRIATDEHFSYILPWDIGSKVYKVIYKVR